MWSQDYKMVWGNADSRTEKLTPVRILGKDKTGIYVFAKLGSINQLVKYDLNYLWNTALELKNSKNKVLDYIEVTVTENKVILFASEYDKITKCKRIYAAYISQSGIVDQKYKDVYTFPKDNSENELQIVYSELESLIIIISSKITMLENDAVGIYSDQFIYVDENLTIHKDFKNTEPKILNAVFHMSESSPGHFLGVYSIMKDVKNNEDLGDEFYLIQIGEQTKEPKEYKLDLGKYTIANVNLLADTVAERYVIVCGYYFDKNEKFFLGTYSIKIDL
ncbi:MAG TPA: hypothetical protein VK796_08060, partial [Cytophaga sp.]|nr:hypothetical protein [Cytophaga sp.]